MLLLGLLLACGGWRKAARSGDDWMAKENPSAAARAYGRAVDARPEDPRLQARLAGALVADGRPEEAVPHARLAVAGAVEGAEVILAAALVGSWQLDEVASLLEGGTAEQERLLGEAALGRGDLTQAEAHFEAAGTERALAALAYTRARQGDLSTLRELDEGLADLRDPEVLADLFAAWSVAGAATRAAATSDRLLAVDAQADDEGGLGERWVASSQLAVERGRPEGGLRFALRAGAARPQDALAMWQIGLLWLEVGELSQSRAWLEQALSTPPYDAPEFAQGNVVAAEAAGISREERDAVRALIAAPLADVCRDLGDHGAQAAALQVVAQVHGQDPKLLMEIAHAFALAGDPGSGAPWAARASELGHPGAALFAAKSFRAAGNATAALAYANIAWEADKAHTEAALLLAELYVLNSQPHFAIQVLEETLRLEGDPDVRRALERLVQ